MYCCVCLGGKAPQTLPLGVNSCSQRDNVQLYFPSKNYCITLVNRLFGRRRLLGILFRNHCKEWQVSFLKILIIHQWVEWLLFISCWCAVGWLRFYTALTSAADSSSPICKLLLSITSANQSPVLELCQITPHHRVIHYL